MNSGNKTLSPHLVSSLLEEESERRSGHQMSPTKSKRRVQFTSIDEEHHMTTLRGRVYSLSPASSPRKQTKRPTLSSRTRSDVSPHVRRNIKFGETDTSHATPSVRHIGITKEKSRSVQKRKRSITEGESSKVRVQEVKISRQSLSRWKPLSENTRNAFMDVLVAASGPSLNGLSKAHTTQAEKELNSIIFQVREELKSTTAPSTNRAHNCTGLKQQVAVLKEKCLSTVQRNTELEERLTDRCSDVDTKQSRLQQLSAVTSTRHHQTHTIPSNENNPQLSSLKTCTKDFSTYLYGLLDNGRHKDTTDVLYKT